MKKLYAVLGLLMSISAVANAEQDILKSLSIQSELRVRYVDQTGTDRNKVGNGGFSSQNKQRSRWRNTITGRISLLDEGNTELNFRALRNGTTTYRVNENGENFRKNADSEAWETEIFLTKDTKIGEKDVTWKLGWENKTNRFRQIKDSNGNWKNNLSGKYHTTGYSNEFYFGPSTTFDIFGSKIATDLELVYFNIKGVKTGDYYLNGSDLQGNSGDGWGLNLNLSTKKDVLKGKYGTLGYNVSLVNKFRSIDKVKLDGEKSKSNVYLDYVGGLFYNTPSYKGIYGQISVDNEWEKYTATMGYENTFSVLTTLGYRKSFDSKIGKITINPTIKYFPVYKYTYKLKDSNNGERNTIEYNELRVGVTFGYTPKK